MLKKLYWGITMKTFYFVGLLKNWCYDVGRNKHWPNGSEAMILLKKFIEICYQEP